MIIQIPWTASAIWIGLFYAGASLSVLVCMTGYYLFMFMRRKRIIKNRRAFLTLIKGNNTNHSNIKLKISHVREILKFIRYVNKIQNVEKQQFAIGCLIDVGVVNALRRRIHWSTCSIRLQIVDALAIFPIKHVKDILEEGLADKSRIVRTASALVLLNNDIDLLSHEIHINQQRHRILYGRATNESLLQNRFVDELIELAQRQEIPALIRSGAINILANIIHQQNEQYFSKKRKNAKLKKAKKRARIIAQQAWEAEQTKPNGAHNPIAALEAADVDWFNKLCGRFVTEYDLPVIYAAGRALLSNGSSGHLVLVTIGQTGSIEARSAASFFLRIGER